MRTLTGQDEMAFHDRRAGGPHTRLAGLSAALGGVAHDRLAALTLAMWEEQLLTLRFALFGRRIEAEANCGDCGAGVALIFSAEDLPREMTEFSGEIGALTLGDLLAVEAEGLRGEAGLAALLAAAMRIGRAQAAARLASPDRAALIAALEARTAGLALEIGTACTECGAAMVLPFDVATFLDAELGARAAQLLDEVHLIASAYHWSEREILALPTPRRHDYLARILAAGTLGAWAPAAVKA